jgi:ATP-dependent Clp protease protease subunit
MFKTLTAAVIAINLLINAAEASDLTKVNLKAAPMPVQTIKLAKINQDRVLLLLENITKISVEPIISKIKDFAKTSKEPIYLVIDSNGGSVNAGQTLIDTIRGAKSVRGLKTICVVTNNALSMAAILASYCHQTLMTPSSIMMFHEAGYGVEGTATEIRTYVKFTDKYLKGFEQRLAKQLGITYEQYVELRRDELWLTAEEAVEMGFADALIENFYYEAEPTKDNIFTILFGHMLKGKSK